MPIKAFYLIIMACQAPDFDMCRWMAVYGTTSMYRCEMLRPVAAHIYQKKLDSAEEWIFTQCYREDEILINTDPE